MDIHAKGITYETRANGDLGSIISFDVNYVLLLGWIFPRRGSIFNLLETAVIMALVIGLTTILAFVTCEQPHANQSTCIILPTPSTSYLTLMTLCSFIIGFFVNTVMTRWWATRTALQGVMGAAQELLLIVIGVIGTDENTESGTNAEAGTPEVDNKRQVIQQRAAKYDRLMKQITAYALLVLQMLFNSARDQLPLTELIEKELISAADVSQLTRLNRGKANAFHVCCLLSQTMQLAANADQLLGTCPEIKRVNLQQSLESIKLLRTNAGIVTMYADVQLPYPFIQIVTAVVYAFSIQLVIVCASFISSGSINHNGDLTTGYLTLITYIFVLFGLLRLYSVLENPLGRDSADFPGDSYYLTLRKNLMNARVDAVNNALAGVSDGRLYQPGDKQRATRSDVVDKISYGDKPGGIPSSSTMKDVSVNPLHDEDISGSVAKPTTSLLSSSWV
jgi:predicted membrane chloride channel (bestrophin family)